MTTLEERIASIKPTVQTTQEDTSIIPKTVKDIAEDVASKARYFNIGIANMLGAPVDIVSSVAKSAGLYGEESVPALGSDHFKQMFSNIGLIMEEGKDKDEFLSRAAMMAGETALPFMGFQRAGAKAALKAPEKLSNFKKTLVESYQRPWKTFGAETTAIGAATAAGMVAEEVFPDNEVAKTIAELAGGVTGGAFVDVATSVKQVAGKTPMVSAGRDLFTEQGAQRRASNRVASLSGDVDKARANLLTDTELKLTPTTASGDIGLIALEKAAINADPKLANRVAELTDEAYNLARTKMIVGGNPQDTVDYLDLLRRGAAARSQANIDRLGTDVDPITSSRLVREAIEGSLSKARKDEAILWNKLPNKGVVKVNNIIDGLSNELLNRNMADDPSDVPDFVTNLLGRVDKKGAFITGAVLKNPTLGTLKTVRSRLLKELSEEKAKDVPNRNKMRILGDVQNNVLDSLFEASDEYKQAVDFSRQLNNKFTKGRVGKLLGFERTGEVSTTSEGSVDFLLSGSKDNVRKGLRQLKEASPESIPLIEENIKSLFNLQAINVDGALSVNNARRFLKNKAHLLEEFPNIKRAIEDSLSSQSVTDEMFGANIGGKASTYVKDKSIFSLYLDGTPESAMHRLVTAKNSEGAGAVMRNMLDVVKQDETGSALKGLRSAFGEYLIKHSEANDGTILSGKKMAKMLKMLDSSATQLYSNEELGRFHKIADELKRINVKADIDPAIGGVISDAPNKIISIVSGTIAARVGGNLGGGSGASLRTANIASREVNQVLGRLTNDGAVQILTKAIEDPQVLKVLLDEATPQNVKSANKVFKSFLTGQILTSQSGQDQSVEESLQERINRLKEQQ